MQLPVFTKYGFRIRTRVGMTVDNLLIQGQDESDARRKLQQMYHNCEVLECVCQSGTGRSPSTSYEEILGLLSR